MDGVRALPITGLLTFLVGVVIAYQGAEQLRKFGTNIFIVDLVGISLLRERAADRRDPHRRSFGSAYG